MHGRHLLGITRVGDTPYYVWLIALILLIAAWDHAHMLVLDCLRGFERLTGYKWRHAGYIRCHLQRCCLQRIHALLISDGKGVLDSIMEATGYGDKVFHYLCVNAAVGIGFSCGIDTLARAAGQVEREH